MIIKEKNRLYVCKGVSRVHYDIQQNKLIIYHSEGEEYYSCTQKEADELIDLIQHYLFDDRVIINFDERKVVTSPISYVPYKCYTCPDRQGYRSSII